MAKAKVKSKKGIVKQPGGGKLDPYEAPAYLSEKSRALWRSVNKEFVLEQSSLQVLEVACSEFDRYLAARELVNKHGIVIKSKGGQLHGNPAVGVQERALKGFAKGWQLLGLNMKPPTADDEKERVQWETDG